MKFFRFIEKAFRALLPSPFSIALLLTAVTFLIAWFSMKSDEHGIDRVWTLLTFWEEGLWDAPMLAFAVQMMLMLVLGHVLALTTPVDRFIGKVTQYCDSTARSAAIVTVLTISVGLFNWGLGLIFGAILARKVGEHAARKGIALNYALVGAAGYSGMMVWHGGVSGSAPIKAADSGHVHELMTGVLPGDQLNALPEQISLSETTFGGMNLLVMVLLIVLLPLFMYWMGKRSAPSLHLPQESDVTSVKDEEQACGAERLDAARWFSLLIGSLIFGYLIAKTVFVFPTEGLGIITPNFINLLLLGMALMLHESIRAFLKAIDAAIGGASGILIQFPLYFGILGIMKHSGLVTQMSDFFVAHSTVDTFPMFTFFSAGLVNVFVPSGGGQWMIQGPIVINAATAMGASIPKAIMALSYGDQITNMLQPFWALPLLGITGLKAREILPYTFALMLVGCLIFLSVLILF